MEAGTSVEDSIEYLNDSNKQRSYSVEVSAYDLENERIVDEGNIYITLEETEVDIERESSTKIGYKVTLPSETIDGSYFNVIYLVEKSLGEDEETLVDIRHGLGALVVVNAVKPGEDIKNDFINSSAVAVATDTPFIPFLDESTVEITYINNSKYIFKPQGEVRIYDTETDLRLAKFRFNEGGDITFPSDTVEETFRGKIWDIRDTFNDKRVVYRIYSQYGDKYITGTTTLKAPSIYILLLPAAVLVAGGYLLLRRKRVSR